MKSLYQGTDVQEIRDRVQKIKAETKPLWGKMNATEMIVHLNQSFKMAMGKLKVEDKSSWLTRTLVKYLIVNTNLIKMPKNIQTAKELITIATPFEFAKAREEFLHLLDEITRNKEFASHPLFGKLSNDEWGRLGYKHVDHHLSQFGF